MYAAERLAEWSSGLEITDVPPEVVAAAKLHLLDAVGTGLAGLAFGQMEAARAVALEMGGPEESSAFGLPRRIGAGAAALANGATMHALDFDDTHEVTLIHSSVVVGATVLAAGEASGASGAELLASAIAGYEISSRVGLAAPGALHLKGFHPTSVCGVFAATAAAARLRGLSAEQTANALGIAGSQASGLMEYLADGSQTKPLHAGWAAHAGITAAALAAHGATGPASVLEGRFGLLASHVGEFDEVALTAELGSRWETTLIAFKAYPSCHLGHAVLDAVRESGLGPDGVEEIVAEVAGDLAIGLVLEPADRKLRPATPYEAKFSLPYCIGALLVRGELGLDSFTGEAIGDERVLDLAARVSYEVVDFGAGGGDISGGVRARAGGRKYAARVLRPRGTPANPLSESEVRAKFLRNASLLLAEPEADQLLAILSALEDHSAAEVGAALQAAAGPVRRSTASAR
ncbi:MAG TPA: MmgE/PrpD family protein [Solirubrobacterales bacterium]|nr:MmgE/PrpD family protein [Solirubrobacterales bacterium]